MAVHDQLDPKLDNGAQGRNTYKRAGFVPPSKLCDGRLDGSDQPHLLRVLPKGPLAPDGSLAFTSGVCVYLPAGYERSGLRYPVIYLLHGGGGDASDMVEQGHVDTTMDALVRRDRADAAILVMPDGDNGLWYDERDGKVRNETYLIDDVVPYIDRHFRTIATRSGRAIVGISNGGLGALLMTAKHPQLFVAAGSLSGNLAADTLPMTPPGNALLDHVGALADTDLMVDIGSHCDNPAPVAMCFTKVVDLAFLGANRAFVAAMRAADRGHRGIVDYHENEGGHAWYYWAPILRDRDIPFVLARLADPR